MITMLTRTTLAALTLLTAIGAQATDDYTQELYDIYCTACHAVSASGAPQAFTSEWEDRLDKGINTLVTHAINGIGNMPPMGTCAECSEDDLKNIILYMAQEQ